MKDAKVPLKQITIDVSNPIINHLKKYMYVQSLDSGGDYASNYIDDFTDLTAIKINSIADQELKNIRILSPVLQNETTSRIDFNAISCNAEIQFIDKPIVHSYFGTFDGAIFNYNSKINCNTLFSGFNTSHRSYQILYIDKGILNADMTKINQSCQYIDNTDKWNLDPDNRITSFDDNSDGILSVIIENSKAIPLYKVTINASIKLNARYEPLPEYVPQDYSVELYEEPPPPPVEPTDPYVQKQESLVSFFERMNSAHGNSGKEAFKINEVTVIDSYNSLIRKQLQNDNKTIYFVPNSIIKTPLIKLKRHNHMYWKGKRVKIFDRNIGVKNIPNGTYYYLGKPITF